MRNDGRRGENGENERASRKAPPREDVREWRPANDGPERRHRRGDQRQRERLSQLGVDRELPNAGHATSAHQADEWRDEKEEQKRGDECADDRRRRRERRSPQRGRRRRFATGWRHESRRAPPYRRRPLRRERRRAPRASFDAHRRRE